MFLRLWRSTFGVVLIIALGFAVAATAISGIAYQVTHEALEMQIDHRVSIETRSLVNEAREEGLAALIETIRQRSTVRAADSLDYLLVDQSGQRLAGSIDATVSSPGYDESLSFSRGGYTAIGQALTTRLPGATLVVVADRRDLTEIDQTLAALFAGSMAAMLLLGITAAAFIGWLTRHRLSRIDATALAIIEGNFDQRVPRDYSGTEFDRLAETINRMLDRIAALMGNLRQVSTDVAHDLRTPLTRLYGLLEKALSDEDNPARLQSIKAARIQAGEMLDIFAALLRIAEVEGLAERRHSGRVDLTGLLDEMVETYRPDIEASSRLLRADVSSGLVVLGDRRLLAQAVSNLIENALRHTPQGTIISLSAQQCDNMIEIVLEDNGTGVVPSEAERLFQRFSRSDLSRATPGHGLGLALVRAVATAHRGRAEIRPAKGFKVVLTLPAELAE